MASEVVDVHIDVMCPWAYQTTKWLRDVRTRKDLDLRWRFFSLEEVNRVEGKKHPWEREWSYGWSMMRIGALLRRDSMDDLDRWFELAGRALHEDGRKPHHPDVAEQLLRELDLDPGYVRKALADETTHAEVKADHDRVLALGGFGVPTLVFDDGTPLFGPVVTPGPTGDKADRLWELVLGWKEFPHLYELRRTKSQGDWDHIAEQFQPYLGARDWETVQNPAP
jgi:2-hydroxychromene-2-carboxylate isomerase